MYIYILHCVLVTKIKPKQMDNKLNIAFDEKAILRGVYKKLNNKLGKDVSKLSSLTSSVSELKSLQTELEHRVNELHHQKQDLKYAIEKESSSLNLLEKTEKVKAYQKWISSIEDLSSQIEANFEQNNEDIVLLHYEKLKESAELLSVSDCFHLKKYTCDMILHWHKILVARLEEEFELLLKSIKWPLVAPNSSTKMPIPSEEKIKKLESLIKYLLQLDLSDEIRTIASNVKEESSEEFPSLVSDFVVNSVPVLLLLKPLQVEWMASRWIHLWVPSLQTFFLFIRRRHLCAVVVFSHPKFCRLNVHDVCTLNNKQQAIQFCNHINILHPNIKFSIDFKHFELYHSLMCWSKGVRFCFHFNGEKGTNSCKNPEWYLSQVLKWIAAHESFLECYIQPILNQCGQTKVNAKIQFIKGLLHLVVAKLHSDIPQVKDDEDLFCRTIQETLNFERELRLGYGYPSSQPTVLNVITQANVFHYWISVERKFALELMDDFVASPYSWQSEDPGGICHCGEQLILLLQGITDRYKGLFQPGHRLQFLDLQLELLDDFRVRILQLAKSELSDPFNSNYIPILNTVHYMVNTIGDWADLPFFVEMQYFKENFSSAEEKMRFPDDSHIDELFFQNKFQSKEEDLNISNSAFGSILNLYNHIELEMLSVISRHVVTEVRARSQSYRKDKWFYTPTEPFSSSDSSKIIEISPSLCPLLEALVKHLMQLRKKLAPDLFSRIWKELASCLNKFIYEEVILQNNFSEYGANQLNYDMTKAFFPIFGEFTLKPENYFPMIKEALILLTLPRATAFLLKDTLEASKENRDFYNQNASPVKALEERGVFLLSVHDAHCILNIRTNMVNL
ncbi:RAD50-interacting protein 1 [Armadillidium nasatum]|uniref:RAD50-interacting protein 1 n=1 Tax=Armadillidium nasatum TaxID=96803 RepID=A0A5N5SQI3_9CRUS|nr:RAD50-interacting protein 1 [Armadillidium nasatum]